MTELELVEASTAYMDLSIGATGLYFTIVSAYLVAAYLAGKNLSSVQLSIVNLLYVFGALVHALGSATYASRANEYAIKIEELSGGQPTQLGVTVVPIVWFAILVVGIAASLYFMWTTRAENRDVT